MAQKSYRDAIREALREEMHRDERVLILGEEVGVWGGTYAVTRGLHQEFGDRRVLGFRNRQDRSVEAIRCRFLACAGGGVR